MARAIFLDRDGVINRKPPEGEYVRIWNEIELLPNVFKALTNLSKAGFKLIVVTNQRGIALGKLKLRDLLDIHSRLDDLFARQGTKIAGFYFCPHELELCCECRKPRPGLILQAAKEHQLDLRQCWMIGDSPTDIEAGKRAGCRTVLLNDGQNPRPASQPDLIAQGLLGAAKGILELDNLPASPAP